MSAPDLKAHDERLAALHRKVADLREALENEGAPARRRELEDEIRQTQGGASALHNALHQYRDAEKRVDSLTEILGGLDQTEELLQGIERNLPRGEAGALDLPELSIAIADRRTRIARRITYLREVDLEPARAKLEGQVARAA